MTLPLPEVVLKGGERERTLLGAASDLEVRQLDTLELESELRVDGVKSGYDLDALKLWIYLGSMKL